MDCLREGVLVLDVEESEKLGEGLPNPFVLCVGEVEESHKEGLEV